MIQKFQDLFEAKIDASDPYSFEAESGSKENGEITFRYDNSSDRQKGIKLLVKAGIKRKDISTWKEQKGFKHPFCLSFEEK